MVVNEATPNSLILDACSIISGAQPCDQLRPAAASSLGRLRVLANLDPAAPACSDWAMKRASCVAALLAISLDHESAMSSTEP